MWKESVEYKLYIYMLVHMLYSALTGYISTLHAMCNRNIVFYFMCLFFYKYK